MFRLALRYVDESTDSSSQCFEWNPFKNVVETYNNHLLGLFRAEL